MVLGFFRDLEIADLLRRALCRLTSLAPVFTAAAEPVDKVRDEVCDGVEWRNLELT